MSENENVAAAEKAEETTETQKTEEVTEAVVDQSPSTDKGIDIHAVEENADETAKSENTAEEATADSKSEDKADETTAIADEEKSIPDDEQEISYHAVEKEGTVTAIWEMQGNKHLRTIAPRSNEGQKILSLFETAV